MRQNPVGLLQPHCPGPCPEPLIQEVGPGVQRRTFLTSFWALPWLRGLQCENHWLRAQGWPLRQRVFVGVWPGRREAPRLPNGSPNRRTQSSPQIQAKGYLGSHRNRKSEPAGLPGCVGSGKQVPEAKEKGRWSKGAHPEGRRGTAGLTFL